MIDRSVVRLGVERVRVVRCVGRSAKVFLEIWKWREVDVNERLFEIW